MRVEDWPIDKPVPYPRNARNWSAKAIEKVAASIRQFGFRQPIVVDAKGVIVVGHLRMAAARYLQLAKVPVHVASDLSPNQIKAYRIADNRTHEEAQWNTQLLGADLIDLKVADFNLEFTGFENSEIIESVFGGGKRNKAKAAGAGEMPDALQFKIVLDCSGESHQAELLTRFKTEGLACRALIS